MKKEFRIILLIFFLFFISWGWNQRQCLKIVILYTNTRIHFFCHTIYLFFLCSINKEFNYTFSAMQTKAKKNGDKKRHRVSGLQWILVAYCTANNNWREATTTTAIANDISYVTWNRHFTCKTFERKYKTESSVSSSLYTWQLARKNQFFFQMISHCSVSACTVSNTNSFIHA